MQVLPAYAGMILGGEVTHTLTVECSPRMRG